MRTFMMRPTQRRAVGNRGFSLVELLLVMVILATLAAVVVPRFAGRSEQARVAAAQTDIAQLRTAIDAFEIDNGFYPRSDVGLQALTVQPSDARNWRGPYLSKEVTTDPWGNPYIYVCPGQQNPSGYDLSSMGPDGQEGTENDITNWN